MQNIIHNRLLFLLRHQSQKCFNTINNTKINNVHPFFTLITRNNKNAFNKIAKCSLSTSTITNMSTHTTNPLHQTMNKPPIFSTNPSIDSMKKLKKQAKMAFKITAYTLLSMTAATTVIWQSYHWYIEYFLSPSPKKMNYKAKLLLHGAYFREQIAVDYSVAAIYMEEALKVALEEIKLNEHDDDIIQLRLRLAFDEWHAGNLFDAITQYTHVWTSLLNNNNNNNNNNLSSSSLLIQTAKNLGDLYIKIGDYDKAEEYLAWTFHTLNNENQQPSSSSLLLLKINTLCSLASLYALQRQFQLALPLFLQALQLIPNNGENEEDDEKYQWLCKKAILQNQLSETLFGMGKKNEALGWAQSALESTSNGLATYLDANDCRECGSVASNNLGKLLELKGEFDQALIYYKQAQVYASTLDDSKSQARYDENVVRLENLLENDNRTTAAKDIVTSTSTNEKSEKKDQKQSWKSWFSKSK
ncbi:unnamed protein product [Cunninghamella blakesleeana]